jgi:hypothetical protein
MAETMAAIFKEEPEELSAAHLFEGLALQRRQIRHLILVVHGEQPELRSGIQCSR